MSKKTTNFRLQTPRIIYAPRLYWHVWTAIDLIFFCHIYWYFSCLSKYCWSRSAANLGSVVKAAYLGDIVAFFITLKPFETEHDNSKLWTLNATPIGVQPYADATCMFDPQSHFGAFAIMILAESSPKVFEVSWASCLRINWKFSSCS